jgi:hypothetical protein
MCCCRKQQHDVGISHFFLSFVVTDETFFVRPSKEMVVEIRLLIKLAQVSLTDALEAAFHCHVPYFDYITFVINKLPKKSHT